MKNIWLVVGVEFKQGLFALWNPCTNTKSCGCHEFGKNSFESVWRNHFVGQIQSIQERWWNRPCYDQVQALEWKCITKWCWEWREQSAGNQGQCGVNSLMCAMGMDWSKFLPQWCTSSTSSFPSSLSSLGSRLDHLISYKHSVNVSCWQQVLFWVTQS